MKQIIQPDVIPAQHSQTTVPPPAAFTNDFVEEPIEEPQDVIVKPPDEQLYSNVNKTVAQETNIKSVELINDHQQINEPQSPIKEQQQLTQEQIEHIDPIYQNQEDLTEYIEDTGVKAVRFVVTSLFYDLLYYSILTQVAMYDYQAAADDEISFDPDDIITHIEQVIQHFDLFSFVKNAIFI